MCIRLEQCFSIFLLQRNPMQWSTCETVVLLQPHRTVVANFVPDIFGLFWPNPWQRLAEPRGSAEARLKNTGLGSAQTVMQIDVTLYCTLPRYSENELHPSVAFSWHFCETSLFQPVVTRSETLWYAYANATTPYNGSNMGGGLVNKAHNIGQWFCTKLFLAACHLVDFILSLCATCSRTT